MTPVTLLDSTALIFTEVSAGADVSQVLATWWDEHARKQPSLFNGPLIACQSCELDSKGAANIAWYRTCYAHYLQRTASAPVTNPARALFCSVVLVSNTGDFAIGKMSETTSSPFRLQLPGGNITWPDPTGLSLSHCAVDACQELREEVGISVDVSALRLWRVKTGGKHNDVGVIFECRSALNNAQIQDVFRQHQNDLRSRGETPEFSQLTLIHPAQFRSNGIECVDYLPSVAHAMRHSGG
jgi:hypothetical protein